MTGDAGQYILSNYNYWMSILLMMVGFFIVIDTRNLVKKMIGLGIFQTSVLLLYISVGYVHGAHVPILKEGVEHYVNPLPHVLMLTAIVVGVATLAVGLAIAVRIKEAYGTIEDDEVIKMDHKLTVRNLQHSDKLAAQVAEEVSQAEPSGKADR